MKIWYKLGLYISWLAFVLLNAAFSNFSFYASGIEAVVFVVLLFTPFATKLFRLEKTDFRNISNIISLVFIELFSFLHYQETYVVNPRRLDRLQVMFGIDADTIGLFLKICGYVGVICAIPAIIWLIKTLKLLIEYIDSTAMWGRVLTVLLVGLLQYFSLGYTAVKQFYLVFGNQLRWFLINYAIVLCINLVFIFLTRNIRISLSIVSVYFFLWSVANYYVTLWHGSPMFFSEFSNMKTAMNMVGGYQFELHYVIVLAFILLYINLKLAGKCKGFITLKKVIVVFGTGCVLSALLTYLLVVKYQGELKTIFSWNMNAAISSHGFMVCTFEDAYYLTIPFEKPEGYDEAVVETWFEEDGNKADITDMASGTDADFSERKMDKRINDNPDIILIINESLFDLRIHSEIDADKDFLPGFYDIEGAKYGNAITSNAGGGTNNSEFELLSFNSMMLLPRDAPFNYVHMEKIPETVVSRLNGLGYTTAAIHSQDATNYSRSKAYPAMGFDEIYLGENNYDLKAYYGNRGTTDASEYEKLEKLYEEMGDNPRFIYLLTFQNHGGYELNDPSMDLIHSKIDYADMTDDVDEYLTSLSLSAEAFIQLTDYYKNSDRKVIICMVGDHSPSIIPTFTPLKFETETEEYVVARMVPYVFWTNEGTLSDELEGYATLTDLVPMLFKEIGFETTAYEDTILELRDAVPIRTKNGRCIDKNGKVWDNMEKCPDADLLKKYYDMEYYQLMR